MFNSNHTPDLSDLFVCLFSSNEVEEREDNARHIAQPFCLDLHGRPEASVQRSQDPCSSVVCGIVHIGHGLWARESDKGAEISGGV